MTENGFSFIIMNKFCPFALLFNMINLSKTIDHELGNLLQIKDNHAEYVVSLDEFVTGNHKGIIHMNLWDFLMAMIKYKPLPLSRKFAGRLPKGFRENPAEIFGVVVTYLVCHFGNIQTAGFQ